MHTETMAASVVSYGRRKGTPRSQESGLLLDDKVPANQVAILTSNDWSRIQQQLSGVDWQKEAARRRRIDREEKHQKSLDTVKHWGNTIEGQRLKRLEARKIKQQKEEEARQHIDEEEAKFQAGRRKAAIDKAKTMIYYRTDKVKEFHSALQLSEVLKEREAQIAFKNKRDELYKMQDVAYARYQEEERERGKMADMQSAEERNRAKAEVAKFQLTQMTEHITAKQLERQQQLQEQAAIDKEVEMWKEKEEAKERKKEEDKKILRSELDQLLEDNKISTAHFEEQEKAEDEERQVFAAAKKNMMKMRKTKEKEIFKEFQEHQDKMITHIHGLLKQKVSNEDERIAKAVAEQDAKKAQAEKEKAEKYIKSMKEIHEHRKQMMAEQQSKENERKKLDQELLRQRIAQDQKFYANEMQKQKKKACDAQDMQTFHKAQMVEIIEREKADKMDEESYRKQNMDLLKVEEDQFQQYADQVIKEAKSRGAPLYPLKVASKKGCGGGHGRVFSGKGGVRPSYQTCDSTAVELPTYTSKQLPVSWRPRNTQKRMGFTW